MKNESDLLIIGAGPAGTGAALAASECGLKTVLIDSSASSGGAVYRALPASFRTKSNSNYKLNSNHGETQRKALNHSPVTKAFDRTVWSIDQDLQVETMGPDGRECWRTSALLAAAGAYERVIPFPGWTSPYVIGLAAATTLLKSQHVLPGQRTLVAGCGPLLALVASHIINGGGHVVAVLDLANRADWFRTIPALISRPTDLKLGLQWRAQIRAAGVPWLYRTTLRSVENLNGVVTIEAGPVDTRSVAKNANTRVFEADCVTVGHGLVPSTEITRLLGAQHIYKRESGGWVPRLDENQRTTHERLYAAGDGSGIHGAANAWLEGRIAGYTTALDLKKISAARHRHLVGPLKRAREKSRRAGNAMARQMAERPEMVQAIAPDTIVCRCEDVTRDEIDQAVIKGATNINQLKSWTRCGMGPCQGRLCGDTAAALIACHTHDRVAAGILTSRVPLRPVDIGALTGSFDYNDIPIPKAAPL